jgi:ribosome-associated toxin RatA of RatAB toxin-antitoxin module
MKELHGTSSASVAAGVERCFELLAAVDRYPNWYPEVVRSVEVVERDPDGRPTKARASLHVAQGPLVRDFALLLSVQTEPFRVVRLTRIPHEPSDPERFQVAWSLGEGPETRIGLELSANLSVPRFVPVGAIGDGLARGFVASAVRELR